MDYMGHDGERLGKEPIISLVHLVDYGGLDNTGFYGTSGISDSGAASVRLAASW